MTAPIHILIVDDQPRARKSLHALLNTLPYAAAVEEAADGQQALCCIERSVPSIVITDVRMPVMDGLQATHAIKARWPDVKVIVLSLYSEYAEDALAAGASAFVSKCEPPTRLLEALTGTL
jgi:YesN/AraC family two-component response regulator